MDTIVYKIHNASKYPFLIAAIDVVKNKGRSKIDFESGVFKNPNIKDFDTAFANIKLGKFRWVSPIATVRIPSFQSDVVIQHEISDDRVRFEYSIPKFYMSNNVCEVIPGLSSKWSKSDTFDMASLCCDYWYKIIRTSIHHVIFSLTSGLEKIANFDIEVSRFDIALNQIFDNIDDALFYLDAQKRARIPKAAEINFVPFASAITSKDSSNRWYWKIYHKGLEFKKNSVPHIRKKYEVENLRSQTLRRTYENLPALQIYADCCLRYELECKSGLMSYLFNQHFKKAFHKGYRKYFSLLDSIYRENGRIDVLDCKCVRSGDSFQVYKHGSLLPDGKERNRILKKYTKLAWLNGKFGWDEKTAYKYYDFYRAEQGKEHLFFLEVETKRADKCVSLFDFVAGNQIDKKTGEVLSGKYLGFDIVEQFEKTELRQKFSKYLLLKMIEKHQQFFSLFQFQTLPDYSRNILNVDHINSSDRSSDRVLFFEAELSSVRSQIFFNTNSIDTLKSSRYDLEEEFYSNSLSSLKEERASLLLQKKNFIASLRDAKLEHFSNKKTICTDGQLKKIMLLLDKYKTFEAIKAEGFCDASTLYRWRKTMEKITNSRFNFVANDFVKNICTQVHTVYENHYKNLYVNSTPLGLFLEISALKL